jgi:peptide/nickel transport system permease protein
MLAGLMILLPLCFLALSAPALEKAGILSDPLAQTSQGLDADGMPLAPSGTFLLGTDNLGRDLLSRVVRGARVSLAVGIAATMTATLIGGTVGLLAGFYGNRIDLFLMRLTEIMMAIPALLLAIAFAGLLDAQGRVVHLHPQGLSWHALDLTLRPGVVTIFLIIGFVSWTGIVRVVRGQVLSIRERAFVQAARALGASDARLVFTHLLPNIIPTLLVVTAMNTAGVILLEAGLSYLGIGVPPPAPSWGSLIADGQPYFIVAPHIVIVPGVAIALTVLAFNLLGQGLQELLDPFQQVRS